MVFDQLLKILPVLLILPLGYLLKRIHVLKKEDNTPLLKLFIKVTLPATLFLAFSQLEITSRILLLAGLGLVVVILLFLLGYVITLIVKPASNIRKIFLIVLPALAPATVAYPFFMELYGEVGLSTIALINIGNILFLFTADKFIAMRLSNQKKHSGFFMQFIESPIIWSMVLGLLFSYFNIYHDVMTSFFEILAAATIFIIMIALGLGFEWNNRIMKEIVPIIITKTCLGLLIGYGIAVVLGLTGLERIAILIYAFVPASAVTYVFVSEEKLDKTLEADLLSFSLPLGAILTGVFLMFSDAILLTPVALYIGAIGTVVGVVSMYFLDKKSA
ncbi:AEC family transporter [candidate division KSB1 bacterium]